MKQEEKEAIKKYDTLARKYHLLRTKTNPRGWHYNEHLEMPATLELLGDVKGKKLLDIGCGSGIYAKKLTQKGAIVKGFDISRKMLEIARKSNPTLDLRVGSAYTIPFKEKFDIAYASLIIDYLDDWDKLFKEVRLVLKKNGFFIFSHGNPVSETTTKVQVGTKKYRVLGIQDYFKEKKIYGTWIIDKKSVKMPSYHKTYETIIKLITKNGFEIVGYKDTFPTKLSKKLFPADYEFTSKIPYFCVWKLRKK